MAETKNIDWRSGDISAEANLEVGSDQNKESSSNDSVDNSKDEIDEQKTEETTTTSETENSKPITDTDEKLRSVSGETDISVSVDPELEQIKQRVREMEQEAERLKVLQQQVERDVMGSQGQSSAGHIVSVEHTNMLVLE